MKKNVFGRQFKRDKNQRTALFKGLMSALIINGRIKTTQEKAKAIKGEIEKLVTKSKKGEVSRRLLQKVLAPDLADKLIKEIGPRFSKRPGGYTRIIRIGRRVSDNASTVFIEWVEGETVPLVMEKPAVQISESKKKEVTKEVKSKKVLKTKVKKETKK